MKGWSESKAQGSGEQEGAHSSLDDKVGAEFAENCWLLSGGEGDDRRRFLKHATATATAGQYRMTNKRKGNSKCSRNGNGHSISDCNDNLSVSLCQRAGLCSRGKRLPKWRYDGERYVYKGMAVVLMRC